MFKMSEIFDFNSEKNKGNKKSQVERMKQLNETYQKRGEFIKEDSKKEVDENKINEESARLKKLSTHRMINEYGNDGIPFMGMKQAGQGETVNTFLPTIPDSARNSSFSYIKPEEALDISIKRAIESGTPINNMGFYDEVNWILNNLGFDSKNPVDIKSAMIKIAGGDLNTSVD
tara:strand:- start:305 stop:826 length:522 start_codon:yes stop_codon:yes gene_type:complete